MCILKIYLFSNFRKTDVFILQRFHGFIYFLLRPRTDMMQNWAKFLMKSHFYHWFHKSIPKQFVLNCESFKNISPNYRDINVHIFWEATQFEKTKQDIFVAFPEYLNLKKKSTSSIIWPIFMFHCLLRLCISCKFLGVTFFHWVSVKNSLKVNRQKAMQHMSSIVSWVMEFLTRGYKISFIFPLKWMCKKGICVFCQLT